MSNQQVDALRQPPAETVDTDTLDQNQTEKSTVTTPDALLATAAKIAAELAKEKEAVQGESTTVEGVQAKAEALAKEKAAQELFTRLGKQNMDDMHSQSKDVGKWSYYQLSGNKKEFEKALANGEQGGVSRFNPDFKGTHARIGYGRTLSLSDEQFPSVGVETPLDYIQICKKDIDLSGTKLEGAPAAPQLKEFISREGEQFVSVSGKEKSYSARVKDLPPDVAYALFMRQYNGKDPAYQAEHNRILKKETETSLKAFSDTALKEGDLMTAIEGYSTLGKMSDLEVVSALTQKMEAMQHEWKAYNGQLSAGDPELSARMNEEHAQLQRAVRRLDEYRLSGK